MSDLANPNLLSIALGCIASLITGGTFLLFFGGVVAGGFEQGMARGVTRAWWGLCALVLGPIPYMLFLVTLLASYSMINNGTIFVSLLLLVPLVIVLLLWSLALALTALPIVLVLPSELTRPSAGRAVIAVAGVTIMQILMALYASPYLALAGAKFVSLMDDVYAIRATTGAPAVAYWFVKPTLVGRTLKSSGFVHTHGLESSAADHVATMVWSDVANGVRPTVGASSQEVVLGGVAVLAIPEGLFRVPEDDLRDTVLGAGPGPRDAFATRDRLVQLKVMDDQYYSGQSAEALLEEFCLGLRQQAPDVYFVRAEVVRVDGRDWSYVELAAELPGTASRFYMIMQATGIGSRIVTIVAHLDTGVDADWLPVVRESISSYKTIAR